MSNSDGTNVLYYILVTVFGIAGMVNLFRAFSAPSKDQIDEFERIIDEKDKIIENLEFKVLQYQQLINDSRGSKLE